MPQLIEVPGMGVVEFPDGMGDAEISAAIRRSIGAQQPVQETYDPTEGMSGFDKFAAGVGKAISDTGLGLKQLYAHAADLVAPRERSIEDLITETDNSRVAEVQRQIDEVRKRDAALMDTGAGLAGNIAGTVGTFLTPGVALKGASMLPKMGGLATAARAVTAPETIRGAAALGAGLSAIQPVASDESRGANVALGAAAGAGGQALGKAIGKVVKPVKSALSASKAAIARRAEELGAILTPGQRTGSTPLRQLEAGMESFPITAGKMSGIKENNQAVLNRVAAKAIGQDSDVLSESVLGRAYVTIGDKFNAVADDTIRLGDDFIDDLSRIEKNYQSVWGSRGDPQLKAFLDDALEDATRGAISGEKYVALRSELSKKSKDAFTGSNSRLGRSINEMIDALDDAAERSIDPAKSQALREARGQWKTLKTLEKSLNGENVSGPKLANSIRRGDPKGYIYGFRDGNDLYDMAKFADNFRGIVGDSGTATRLGYQVLGGGLGGGVVSGLTGGDPMTGIAYGAGIPLAMRGAQGAYLSAPMQRYLASGLLPVEQIPHGLLAAGRSGSTLLPVGLLNALQE